MSDPLDEILGEEEDFADPLDEILVEEDDFASGIDDQDTSSVISDNDSSNLEV